MKTFYQFMQEQYNIETWTYEDVDSDALTYIRNNCDMGTLSMTYFTVAVKLAIETNNPNHRLNGSAHHFETEATAMLTAYFRAHYITAEEYCNYYNTLHHLMRVNWRAKKPYKRNH